MDQEQLSSVSVSGGQGAPKIIILPIVVTIALIALVYFSQANGASATHSKSPATSIISGPGGGASLFAGCFVASGYICSHPAAVQSGASNISISLDFGQATSATTYNSVVSIAPQSSALNSAGFPAAIVTNTLGTLPSGVEEQVSFVVPYSEFASGGSGSGQFSGYIWLNYSTLSPASPSSSAVKAATIIVQVK